jgi:hypothetical protein
VLCLEDAESYPDLDDGSPLLDVEAPKPVGIWSLAVHKCRSAASERE